MSTPRPGSTAAADCGCATGYTLSASSGRCVACSSGMFAKAGAIQCRGCPDHSESCPGSTTCECTAGYTGVVGRRGSLKRCMMTPVDCRGSWGTCNIACRRTYAVGQEASGGGAACEASDGQSEDCAAGDGLCEAVDDSVPAPPPCLPNTIVLDRTIIQVEYTVEFVFVIPNMDCAGVRDGLLVSDACGVCNGTNTTCLDCAAVPAGNATTDECGFVRQFLSLSDTLFIKFQRTTQRKPGLPFRCGVCNDDPADDCAQDCRGDWGGTVFNDICDLVKD